MNRNVIIVREGLRTEPGGHLSDRLPGKLLSLAIVALSMAVALMGTCDSALGQGQSGNFEGRWVSLNQAGESGSIDLKPMRGPGDPTGNVMTTITVFERTGGAHRELHRGTVDWQDANTFTITTSEGKIITYRRETPVESPATFRQEAPVGVPMTSRSERKPINFVGIWDIVDPDTGQPVSQIEFRKDHTYLVTTPDGRGDPRPWKWFLEGDMVRFQDVPYHPDMATFRVKRKADDVLEFYTIRGAHLETFGATRGKSYQLQRQ